MQVSSCQEVLSAALQQTLWLGRSQLLGAAALPYKSQQTKAEEDAIMLRAACGSAMVVLANNNSCTPLNSLLALDNT